MQSVPRPAAYVTSRPNLQSNAESRPGNRLLLSMAAEILD
jgi:hypothetical protein